MLALSQLQSRAERLPQEHVELAAQGHPSALRLQQVAGLTVLTIVGYCWWGNLTVVWLVVKESCRAEVWFWEYVFRF